MDNLLICAIKVHDLDGPTFGVGPVETLGGVVYGKGGGP